jgi:hypothetical protein
MAAEPLAAGPEPAAPPAGPGEWGAPSSPVTGPVPAAAPLLYDYAPPAPPASPQPASPQPAQPASPQPAYGTGQEYTVPISDPATGAPAYGPPNQLTAPIDPGYAGIRQGTAQIGPSTGAVPPPGYGPPPGFPPPPSRGGSPLTWLLAALALVLVAGITVTAILGINHITKLHNQANVLRAERDTDNKAAQAARDKQKSDLQAADLAGKLKRVHDLDAAADDAFAKWDAGTAKFGVLDDAMDRCDDAVDVYNRAAAPFPTDLLGSLPPRIDLTQPSTDCGRSFTSKI